MKKLYTTGYNITDFTSKTVEGLVSEQNADAGDDVYECTFKLLGKIKTGVSIEPIKSKTKKKVSKK